MLIIKEKLTTKILKDCVYHFKNVYHSACFTFFTVLDRRNLQRRVLIKICKARLQTLKETVSEPAVAFSDTYDIATDEFKDIMEKHISFMSISDEEIKLVEKQTRGQNNNQMWKDKRKGLLTASNFGKAAKTNVEPSKKLKAMLYTDFVTEAILYGRENEATAVEMYIDKAKAKGERLVAEEPGLLISSNKPFFGCKSRQIYY